MNFKRAFTWIIVFALIVNMMLFNYDEAMAADTVITSATWTTYYSSGGGVGEITYKSLTVWGGYYNAACTSVTGNCTYTMAKITAYGDAAHTSPVTLSKTLEFTRVSNTNFTLEEIPNSRYVYFKVTMTHKNGTSASTAGTIKRVG